MAGVKNKIDITGIRYGRLKVTSEAERVKYIRYWNCICDCGKESVVAMGNLRSGYTKSCGCLRSEKVSQAQTRNLMDQKFNMLTVVEKTEYKSKSGNIKWKCLCDCGTETIVIGSALVNGTTKSCGCLRFGRTKVMQDILDSDHKRP